MNFKLNTLCSKTESLLNLLQDKLFPDESCDLIFWTSDKNNMIRKQFNTLETENPMMSFTKLPRQFDTYGPKFEIIPFSKGYIEMIYDIRRNRCTIFVVEKDLKVL